MIKAAYASTETDYGNSVVTFVTIAEAHVDASVRKLFIDSGALDHALSQRLYGEVHDSIHRSWDSRYRWLSQAFGVTLQGTKVEQDFRLLVELRNSIVHGNGEMTSLQMSKVPQMISIRAGLFAALGLESHGRTFLLNQDIVIPAAKICRDYILAFDGEIKKSFPEFDV